MARLPWFRMHTEARTDRKLDLLADDEFRVWHNALCFAAEQSGKRGLIPADCRQDLAIECAHGDTDLLERALSRLVTLRILADTDEGLLFVHFEERQYDKPSDLPEATRDRQSKSRDSHAVSRDVTPCHAKPPLEESREEERREDQEQDLTDEGAADGIIRDFEQTLEGKTVSSLDQTRLRLLIKTYGGELVRRGIVSAAEKERPIDWMAAVIPKWSKEVAANGETPTVFDMSEYR